MEDLFTLAEMINECGYENLILNIQDIETKKNKKKKYLYMMIY